MLTTPLHEVQRVSRREESSVMSKDITRQIRPIDFTRKKQIRIHVIKSDNSF